MIDPISKTAGAAYRLIRYGLLVMLLSIPLTVPAQSLLGNWNARRSALIEWYKPVFARSDPYTSPSSALFLNLRVPVADKITFEADLPWIDSDLKRSQFPGYQNRQTYGAGDPYFGVELHRPTSIIFIQTGLRLPIAHYDTWPPQYLGQYSDISRPGAFFDRAWTFRFMGGVHYENVTGFGVRVKVGPDIVVNRHFTQSNFYFNYNGQLRFDARLFEIGGGLEGQIMVNGGGSLRSRTINEAFIEASTSVGFMQPGMYLALPIDNHTAGIIKYVLGFNIRFRLGAI